MQTNNTVIPDCLVVDVIQRNWPKLRVKQKKCPDSFSQLCPTARVRSSDAHIQWSTINVSSVRPKQRVSLSVESTELWNERIDPLSADPLSVDHCIFAGMCRVTYHMSWVTDTSKSVRKEGLLYPSPLLSNLYRDLMRRPRINALNAQL